MTILLKKSHLEASFALRCFQRLSVPNLATQLCPCARQLVDQRFVHPGPLVLRTAPLKFLTPTADRDRTVSRRSEPSSRATFYPLSDGPSMRNHRITMSYFRTCSTCLSLSQAPLYHYTLRTVTNRAEGTLESLRYSFGGDHPSQTTHQTLSLFLRLDF